jgi:hypothetical protein
MIGQVKQIMVGLYLPFRIIQNTSKENYENEMINFLSRVFTVNYESLEKFLKDCVFYKAKNDLRFSEEIKTAFKVDGELTRENIKEVNYFTKQLKDWKKNFTKII